MGSPSRSGWDARDNTRIALSDSNLVHIASRRSKLALGGYTASYVFGQIFVGF